MNQEETPKTSTEGGAIPPQPEIPTPKRGPNRSRPVKVYLTVLFCAALLLLVISFVMQQRNHMALQDLNEAILDTQEVASLQVENQRLQYEVEKKKSLEEKIAEQERQLKALEWLRQIEEAVRTSYTDAEVLVKEFEKTGLEEALPDQPVIEGTKSPAESYRTIYAMLF